MALLLGHLDYVLVYIKNILIIQREGETEDDHLDKIETVLKILEDAGFRANLHKSFFMQKEVEYLGYTLTQKGLTTQKKKVEAIGRILPPSNLKELKQLLGMVNFYKNVFKDQSHTMAPLTNLAAKCAVVNGQKAKS